MGRRVLLLAVPAAVLLLLLHAAPTLPQPAPGKPCPDGSVLSGQFCICEPTRVCISSDDPLSLECIISTGSNTHAPSAIVGSHFFDRSCTTCQCVETSCPVGSVTDEDGKCVCQRGADSSSHSVCLGSSELCLRTSIADGQYHDWFYPTCDECFCAPCPVGTTKDSDGDCICPSTSYCAGSSQCESENAHYITIGGIRIQVSSHEHFFAPTCTDCFCDAESLDKFVRVANRAIKGRTMEQHANTVAARCAELCLDDARCMSFEAGTGPKVGDCLLSYADRFHVPSSDFVYSSYDYYERIQPASPCDNDNGGCGDAEYTRCSSDDGSTVVCTDIDECLVDSGGCSADELCINLIGMAPECTTASALCADVTCPSGTCVLASEAPLEYACTCPEGSSEAEGSSPCSCPAVVCVKTCADHPCAANAVCTDLPSADGRLGGFTCACPDTMVGDAQPGGAGCAERKACTDANNGGCGPHADCLPGTVDGTVVCTCHSGWTDSATDSSRGDDDHHHDEDESSTCSSPVCSAPCVHGRCPAVGGTCVCDEGWAGLACNQCSSEPAAACKDEAPACSCSYAVAEGRAYCLSSDTCECAAGWGPPGECNEAQCREGCQHGWCHDEPGACRCHSNFAGDLCDVCAAGYELSADGHSCEPVCGDGMRVPYREECDDGNVEDGDGCSSTCVVEGGFECTTPTMGRSTCYDPDECAVSPCNESVSFCVPFPASSGRIGYRCQCQAGMGGDPGRHGEGCSPLCPASTGLEWTACAHSCTQTCDNDCDGAGDDCDGARCQCPSDKPVWFKGKCIARDLCPSSAGAGSAICDKAANGPGSAGCANGGMCVPNEATGTFTCDCTGTNHVGPNCAVLDADTLHSEYGPNGRGCSHGEAVDIVLNDKSFACSCGDSGYTGPNCDVVDCSSAGHGTSSCADLNRLPCSTVPNTCGDCKDGYAGSTVDRNTLCELSTKTVVFSLPLDFDTVVGNPISSQKYRKLQDEIVSALMLHGVVLDYSEVDLSAGSIVVSITKPTAIVSKIQTVLASSGGLVVTLADGTKAKACQGGSSCPVTSSSSSGGSSSRSLSTAATVVVSLVAVLVVVALAIVVVLVRRAKNARREPQSTSSLGGLLPEQLQDHSFVNPIYDFDRQAHRDQDLPMYATADREQQQQDIAAAELGDRPGAVAEYDNVMREPPVGRPAHHPYANVTEEDETEEAGSFDYDDMQDGRLMGVGSSSGCGRSDASCTQAGPGAESDDGSASPSTDSPTSSLSPQMDDDYMYIVYCPPGEQQEQEQ